MNPIKKLASQTAVYGMSSIVGRFLNYLLVPIYTRFFLPEEYGVVSEFYAYSGFLAVALTLGMETGFFRFAKDSRFCKVYPTLLQFLILVSTAFVVLIYGLSERLSGMLHYEGFEIYFIWFAIILACDTVGSLPFAKLRQEEKAKRFAFVKLTEIAVNIGLNLFFMYLLKESETRNIPFFNPAIGVGYIFIANLISSIVKLILLSDQILMIREGFNTAFLKVVIPYSAPMVLIGFAGIINEMLDRALLKYLLPGNVTENLYQLGIYSACYKISIVMSLFIQAFRFAAEPFFFSQSKNEDAPKLYADVMKWFTLFCSCIFVFVTIYLDWFGLFVGKAFREGLYIVPVLLLANMFLGIYVNLSIWYKLTDKTILGAGVSLSGAILTILLLVWWIPFFGYEGAAWATLVCYAYMALTSYLLGKKYFPVPYNVLQLVAYIGICAAVWFCAFHLPSTTVLYMIFGKFLLLVLALGLLLLPERKALQSLLKKI